MTVPAKIAFGALIVAGVTGYMAYLGASSSWKYYALVDECVSDAEELAGRRLRVTGRIAGDSLQIRNDRKAAEFVLEGNRSSLQVTCSAPLPDNLAEGMDVVVEGTLLSAGVLRGDKVLTRCASKYQSQGR